MGEHKERTGKTRAGKFLQGLKGVAPSILELAGTATGITALKELGAVVKGDKSVSESDTETFMMLLNLDIKEAEEVTKRWQADMTSDSWLSKNIRPLVLGWLVIFVSVFAVLDSIESIGITVESAWITLFSTLLVTVIVAYFGSRGVEKYKKISK